jgi:hypothetical protein
MPTPPAELRDSIAQATLRLAASEQEERKLLAALHAARAEQASLVANGDTEGAERAAAEAAELEQNHRAELERWEELQATLQELRIELLSQGEPAESLSLLEPESPIALLPVRIETRFVRSGQVASHLLVRIYPDELHSDGHVEELTAVELAWGQAFADETATAAGDAAARRRAWVKLASRFGSPRAAWIAQVTAPLDPDGGPAPPIAEPPLSGAAWSRAPRAAALPDRWAVLGYRDGQQVLEAWSEPVTEPLAFAPSPAANVGEVGDDSLPLDEGMRWTVDFEDAVKRGMALSIPLEDDNQELGFDLLLAVGVKPSIDSEAGGRRLAALLAAHRFTDGLGLVAPGTPTNNTGEARSRGREDPYFEASFAAERGPARARDANDGALAAEALGIDPLALGRVPGADGEDRAAARAMNIALWPATWGYYLDQMMAATFSQAAIEAGRRHFIEHIRPGGALPALRIGRQPYGLLPVTSLDRWVADEGDRREQEIVSLLKSLCATWRSAVSRVPQIGRSDDLTRDLVEMLGMEPTSTSYAARPLLGRRYLRNLQAFLGFPGVDDWWTEQQAAARAALAAHALPWDPRLLRAAFSPHERPLTGPLVDEPAAPAAGRAHDYLDLLTSETLIWRHLRTEIYAGDNYSYRALLYLLLRHALLAQYQRSAWEIMIREAVLPENARAEEELVDLRARTPTVWALLMRRIPLTTPRTLGDYLDDHQTPELDAAAAVLGEWRAAVRRLSGLATASLERLLGETLDASAHRLDAWISSYAHKRLLALRRRPGAGGGIELGGYGWVEGLQIAEAQQPVPAPPGEEGEPLHEDADDLGYVHAPSKSQAVAAALLRSGYLANGETSDPAFAVDQSSRRARMALEIVEGVRAGRPLGELLGERLERALRDLGLERHRATFQELEPLVAGKLLAANADPNTIAAKSVVDGLKLLERWKKGGDAGIPWGTRGLPSPTKRSAEYDSIIAELRALDEAADASADAANLEAACRLAQGNPMSAGAALDAGNRGDVPPADLQGLRTPRSGIDLTHKLIALVGEPSADTSGWPAASRSRPRALAEPRLNAWLETALGDPAKVRCEAAWTDRQTQEALAGLAAVTVTLEQLGLAALDLLELSLAGGEAQQSELRQRVARHVLAQDRPPGLPPDAQLAISFARNDRFQGDELAFGELLASARALRKLVTEAQPIDRRDLTLPGEADEPGHQVGELEARADSVFSELEAATRDLQLSSDEADELRQGLWRLVDFGVPAAVPPPDAASGELKAQAAVAVTEAERRIDKAGAGDPKKVEVHIERLRAVLGESLPVLPLFTAEPATRLDAAFAASTKLQASHDDEVERWLVRAALVRPGARRLQSALTCAQALGLPLEHRLKVAQLPYEEDDRWLALPFTDERPMRGGRLSLIAQFPEDPPPDKDLPELLKAPLAGTEPLAGLRIDEWTETVPAATETTQIACHYRAPATQAPQAILLAVNPDPGQPWELATLAAILLETFELAKLRAVDPDTLGELGHFLPALLFAYNSDNAAVSTDFRRSVEAA